MSLRSGRERIFQTLSFKLLGLAFAVPVHALLSHTPANTSARAVVSLAVIVTLWC